MFLLVSEQREASLQIIRDLSVNGLFVCYSHFESALHLCREKDTGGVFVDCTGMRAMGSRLCTILRRHYPKMPIAVLIDSKSAPPADVDLILSGSMTDDATARDLLHFFTVGCSYRPRLLCTHYVAVDPQRTTVHFMGYPMRLSPIEHRILYYLLYRTPHAASVDELCAFCSRETVLTLEAIRVYVHRINHRAKQIAPDAPPPIVYCGKHRFAIGV